ncbi:MAG: PilX N-terminal domain-containing pilus assembly protein [Chromatiales bacterium]|jgi:type IV pilus assembly protein PilX
MNAKLLSLRVSSQQGSALIISLLFLLLLTVVGVTAIRNSTLEERMAGNMRDLNIAFQAAEAGLRAAEADLSGALPTFTTTGTDGYYIAPDPDATPLWEASGTNWKGSGLSNFSQSYAAPDYIIEELDPVTQPSLQFGSAGTTIQLYRITARGFGPGQETVAILQATYRR